MSNDGRILATGDDKGLVQLWDVAGGEVVRRLAGPKGKVSAVAFSFDSRLILTGNADGTARLWDARSGEMLRPFKGHVGEVSDVALLPDGLRAITVGRDKTVRLWNVSTGAETRRVAGRSTHVLAAELTETGLRLLIGDGAGKRFRLWNSSDTRTIPLQENPSGDDMPSGPLVGIGGVGAARAWDVKTGRQVCRIADDRQAFISVIPSPDGKRLLTAGIETKSVSPPNLVEHVSVWNVSTGKRVWSFSFRIHQGVFFPPAFSPDGKEVIVLGTGWFAGSGPSDQSGLYDAATGKLKRLIPAGTIQATAFSPDGKRVVGGTDQGEIFLWDLPKDRVTKLAKGTGTIRAVLALAFSPDGHSVVVGHRTGTATIWDLDTGRSITLSDHQGDVNYVGFSPDGNTVVTLATNHVVRFWETRSGREMAQFTSLGAGSWVVHDPDGRFDADQLDAIEGVSWVAPDEPLRPLPPEIFLRDYYEPRLLARILSGEKFEPVRSLADLNRVQPNVEITEIVPQPGIPDEVIVSVKVAGQARALGEGEAKKTYHSGVHDLQLFRDGQVVASFPESEGAITLDAKTGGKTARFEHIRLPRNAGRKQVEFSSYAFNADRVKSPTHRLRYALPSDLTPRKGTAYVICVGVNAFDTPAWDLRFAVPDARVLAKTLKEQLAKSDQFERIVVVPLVSEKEKGVFTENTAVKENLRVVLALLAGKKIDADRLKQIPHAGGLREARPEDLVLLSFSTHGFNGKNGQFYLFPSDIGRDQDRAVNEGLLRRAVSTDELSEWLRVVDAGEMVMIVDACHSAGSIEQKGFKPGPMGSRGLGQLAYNKRMRVLAASQAADVAFEDPRIGHGLLTYALCQDGLNAGLADFAPADKKISVGEWLRYGVHRVPLLAEDIAAGKVKARSVIGRDLRSFVFDRDKGRRAVAQRPSLFDFTRGVDAILLRR